MKLFSELTIPDCCFLSLLQADSNSDLLNLITDREISKYLPGIANMETLERLPKVQFSRNSPIWYDSFLKEFQSL